MTRVHGDEISLTHRHLERFDIHSNFSKFLLENFPPVNGEKRSMWFFRFSSAVGMKASRVKDLFYDPRSKMRAFELAAIQRRWGVLIEGQIAELQARQRLLEVRLEALKGNEFENNTHRRGVRAARGRMAASRSRIRTAPPI